PTVPGLTQHLPPFPTRPSSDLPLAAPVASRSRGWAGTETTGRDVGTLTGHAPPQPLPAPGKRPLSPLGSSTGKSPGAAAETRVQSGSHKNPWDEANPPRSRR